jgi:hypothetical protein
VDPIIPKLDRTSTEAHMAAQSLQFATKVKKFSILTHSLTSLNFFHTSSSSLCCKYAKLLYKKKKWVGKREKRQEERVIW